MTTIYGTSDAETVIAFIYIVLALAYISTWIISISLSIDFCKSNKFLGFWLGFVLGPFGALISFCIGMMDHIEYISKETHFFHEKMNDDIVSIKKELHKFYDVHLKSEQYKCDRLADIADNTQRKE